MADLRIVLARCREGIVARDERIQQLEEALKSARGFMAMVLRDELKHQGWSNLALASGREWLANIDAALASLRVPSEAPEKEGESD